MQKVVLVALAAAFAASLPAQGVIHLAPSKDNTLYESSSGNLSNGAGPGFFCGVNGQAKKRRGLIRFDVAGGLPAGATVVSATLVLEMTQTSSGPLPVELRRVNADWGEGTSYASAGNGGSGTAPTAGDATWVHRFYPNSPWATPGGDFSAVVSASTSVWLTGTYTWTSAQVAADVQDWLTNPATNFGWVLKSPETLVGNAKRFSSREETYLPALPRLAVTYLAPPAAAVTNLGFGCNGLQLVASGLPRVGNSGFALNVSGGAYGVGAYLIVSDGIASSPLDLGGGCFFNLELTSALNYIAAGVSSGPVYFDASGHAAFPAAIPPSVWLHGASLDVQVVSVGTAVTSSNALALLLGS